MNLLKQFHYSTDAEIIAKVLGGETALYEVIIRRYNPYLFKTGRSYGFNHHDTEDLMQETFISAYTNLRKFENRSSFKTWLVKIMLNHCYQRKQKFSFQKEIPSETDVHENSTPIFHQNGDTGKTIINKELGRVMENALQQIHEDYRIVFSLRELAGMSTAEVSEALDISESNVKVRLNRAKGMLRAEIENTYSPEDIFEFNLIYCNSVVEKVTASIRNLKPNFQPFA